LEQVAKTTVYNNPGAGSFAVTSKDAVPGGLNYDVCHYDILKSNKGWIDPGVINYLGNDYKLWSFSAVYFYNTGWIDNGAIVGDGTSAQYVQIGWVWWRRRS
jgi:hypothetical protein